MNFMITIAREAVGVTGHETIEKIETLSKYEAEEKLSGMKIKRRFKNPFNSSIEIVVVE